MKPVIDIVQKEKENSLKTKIQRLDRMNKKIFRNQEEILNLNSSNQKTIINEESLPVIKSLNDQYKQK